MAPHRRRREVDPGANRGDLEAAALIVLADATLQEDADEDGEGGVWWRDCRPWSLRGPSYCYGDPPIAVVQPRAMVDGRASHRE